MNKTQGGGLSRRSFLAGAAGAASWALLGGCSSSKPTAGTPTSASSGGPVPTTLPDPRSAPFDTVVVLMMENRSFDHLLGWLPGANGKQAGLTFPDLHGRPVPTYPLGALEQACDLMDPAHDWQSAAMHFDHGACDGWLRTQRTGDHFPIGYYAEAQVPILGALARNYTAFDNYFCSLAAATWPNRFYQLCGATDVDETGGYPQPGQARPSKLDLAIFDRLHDAGLTGAYYTWGEPMTGLFTSKRYDAITYPKDRFFTDAKAGTLPNVTFLDPDYRAVSEFIGTSNDDHPHGNLLSGEGWMADVYNALKASPHWDRMVLVVNFDENGGFYDHVPPPTVVDHNVNPNPGPHPDYTRLGFRVPAIAISPFSPARIHSAGPYEHCSVLRMIEWRWGLAPMTARDANAWNLAEAFDFKTRRPAFELPAFTPPPLTPCPHPSLDLA